MKKILSASLAFILIALTFTGCMFLNFAEQQTVNFYVDGKLYTKASVDYGDAVIEPPCPDKAYHVFTGWYSGDLRFNFATPIIANLNLYAHFTLDAEAATERISETAAKSTVTVLNKSYNSSMGGFIETESQTSQGSGVVIDISGGWCYVLTNYHVIAKEEGFANQTISVEDPWGNKFDARIYKHRNLTEEAANESYDLALICFQYDTAKLKYSLCEIELGEDPKDGDSIISLGTPEGMKNFLTCGEIIMYQKINTEKNDTMDFEAIVHSAIINHGSSGGPLVDPHGRLVGLNFAGSESLTYGCAIPISKINEFLDIYVYVD